MKTNSLYIHIPFCQDICAYCDFCKVFYQEKLVDDYLEILKEELDSLAIEEPLKTIYIGGGTPSSLNYQQLSFLMAMIKPYLNDSLQEVCIEVNPESIDNKKMKILKDGGITRLSVGVESFNEEILKAINRHHNKQQVYNVIKMAHDFNIDNVSIDLMYGLPKQTYQDIKVDLMEVSKLNIQHISYYSLILEDHTVLKNEDYHLLDEETELKINRLIDKELATLGFCKYEISNFAKPGYQSIHNLAYWHYDNYYGVGIGASGKIDDCLYEHNRNLTAYLKRKNIVDKTIYSKEDTMFNHLMMSLRLTCGLDLNEFKKRYGVTIMDVYPDALLKHLKLKTLVIENDYLKCNGDSMYLLNNILIDFL